MFCPFTIEKVYILTVNERNFLINRSRHSLAQSRLQNAWQPLGVLDYVMLTLSRTVTFWGFFKNKSILIGNCLLVIFF